MRIETPEPKPRKDGDYAVRVTSGYGDPRGDIWLDEDRQSGLTSVRPEDCDRLITAAREVKAQALAFRAQMAAPHGLAHVFEGRCQLCGKAADDPEALHGGPEAPRASDDPAAVLGDAIDSGTPVIIIEDAPRCGLPVWGDEGRRCAEAAGHGPLPACPGTAAPERGGQPDCARRGCGHPEGAHLADDEENADGPCVDAGCQCMEYLHPAPALAAPGEAAGPAALASVATLPGGYVTAAAPARNGARNGGAA